VAATLGVGSVTSFSYAYLAASTLVGATAFSLGLISSAPLTRRGIDPEEAGRHVVHAGWVSLSLVGAAAGVFALDPAAGTVRSLGMLPQPVHDAAGALIGGRVYVFGGGAASSSDAVQTFDPANRRGSLAARLPRPLSDLATAQLDATTYLVGGFDGHAPRPEILATRDGRRFSLAGRLPVGLRYPAVTTAEGKLLIAGGQTATGLSAAVYAFDPRSGTVRLLAHLRAPIAHAAAIVRGRSLYILGGADATGAATGAITAVDLSTHRLTRFARTIGPRADAAAVQLAATTFLIGGRNTHALATVLEIGGGARPR